MECLKDSHLSRQAGSNRLCIGRIRDAQSRPQVQTRTRYHDEKTELDRLVPTSTNFNVTVYVDGEGDSYEFGLKGGLQWPDRSYIIQPITKWVRVLAGIY